MVYKVVVCGDRNWNDRAIIDGFLKCMMPQHAIVVQGGCRGADVIAKEEAEKLGMKTETFNADWKRYGRAAGPIRNKQMIEQNPAMVVAFHNDISKSRGTKNMLSLAKERKIAWMLVDSNGIADMNSYDAQDYMQLWCSCAETTTSHVLVDTAEGKKFQCEQCGSFNKLRRED